MLILDLIHTVHYKIYMIIQDGKWYVYICDESKILSSFDLYLPMPELEIQICVMF
jgi:hypothetical protein